jgi:hypothetical protein
MAVLVPIKPSPKGGTYPVTTPPTVLPTLSAALLTELATKGDDFTNVSGRTYLILVNTDTAPAVINIQPQGSPAGLAVAPFSVSIPASSPMAFGPLDPTLFNNAGGNVRFGLNAANAKVFAVVLQT